MIWLAWRQFRVPVAAVYGVLAAIGVLLAVTGPQLVGRSDFSDQEFVYSTTLIAMYVLPGVVGVFWGVPAVTRELEMGTHNLVWNQTVSRTRWLATKMGMSVLAAMVAAGLLSLAVGWWAGPIDTAASSGEGGFDPRIAPAVFAARGIVPVGYAAFAFVLGVTVGMVLRRTVAAMAVTLAVFIAVQVAVPLVARPYLVPATEETVTVTADNLLGLRVRAAEGGLAPDSIVVAHPADTWLLANETVDANGDVVSPLPATMAECMPGPADGPPDLRSEHECIAQKFADLGYRQHVSYQPASNFWPMQWLETAMFLALSALLAWFCFRRLRHLS